MLNTRHNSIRALGDGLVTRKIDTPRDLPDTILIQYKEARTSSVTLANEFKAAVLRHLTEEKAVGIKVIGDVYITLAQGATITII